ncbi:HTH-type transcriptional regulator VqsM (Virulence and quorum sensing modulator protein), partial [Durusdinium trenchii]
VTITGDYAEISWPVHGGASLGLLVDETAIAALVKFMQKLVPMAPNPTEVAFTSPAPQAPTVYEQFFGCPVLFDAPFVRVRFPANYLSIALPTANPALRQLLDRQAAALASALPGGDPFSIQVQQVILRLLPEARVSLADVAAALAMSARTLQRRLGARSLSFQSLLDRTREELARSYLLDPALSMVEITLLLGFAEQSSFNRAFRQWVGMSPGRWRRLQVYDYVTQPWCWHEWHPSSQSAVSDVDVLGVGDTFDEVIRLQPLSPLPLNIRRQTHYRVVLAEPGVSFEVRGETGDGDLTIHYDLVRVDEGTLFRRALEYEV